MTRGPGRLTITPLPAKEAREVERQVWAAVAANIADGAPLVEGLALFVRAYAARKARRPGRPKGRRTERSARIRTLFVALRCAGATRSEAAGIVAKAAGIERGKDEIDLSTVYRHCTKLP